MAKTVAERAAELDLDQRELAQILRLLSRRNLKRGKKLKKIRYWHAQYELKPHMTEEQAAKALDIGVADAKREIAKLDWKPWTTEQMKLAMFAFYKREGRWPMAREYKLANELPPYRQWMWRGYDELNTYDVRSIDVWERIIARDKRCTPQMAISFRNVLARKEAIDRIGFQTFLKKKLATVREEDPEWGTLYELPGETPSEPMVMLKVINSTAEPDGTFSEYYLRVPPNMQTAREAVRWTFGGDEMFGQQAYEPLVQT